MSGRSVLILGVLTMLLLFFGMAFTVAATVLNKENGQLAGNFRIGKGIVDSYRGQTSFFVRIPELGAGRWLASHGYGLTSRKKYFVGDTIGVRYAPLKTLGKNTLYVEVLDDPPANRWKLAGIFSALAVALDSACVVCIVVTALVSSFR